MKLLFLDIETTGLDPENAELIELSAIRLSADFSKKTTVFDELVLPTSLEIPPFVQNLTGITPDLLRESGKKIDTVRADFAKFLHKDDIICGHNISFDIGFLQYNGFSIDNDSLDTFPLANLLLPDEPSFALEALTQKYKIDHENAHRALADVEANIGLLHILFEKARAMSPELREKFTRIFQKSDWSGKYFFEKAFANPKKAEAKSSQVTIFDIANAPASAESVDSRISQAISDCFSEQYSAVQIPLEKNQKYCAFSAAKNTKNVAIVTKDFSEIPSDFSAFAPPDKVFCPRAFEKWFAGKSEFSLEETIAALKTFRAEEDGSTMILADLPLFRGEKDVAKNWGMTDHSRCDDRCPAHKMTLESRQKTHFLCRLEDAPFCPANKLIVLDSADLERKIDSLSREFFSLKFLEKLVSEAEKDSPEFAESVFFGLGLFAKKIREIVGQSSYHEHFLADDSFFDQEEVRNLHAGFLEAAKKIPEFATLADFLSPPEHRKRLCITISGKDELSLVRAPAELTPIFEDIFSQKDSVVFLDSRFLKKGGRFFFGSGLPSPEIQHDFASDFSESALFAIPTFGGNAKTDGAEKTANLLAEILPKVSKNLLVLFPSAKILDHFLALGEESARKNGFEMVIANGSPGKIAAKIATGKNLVLATANNFNRLNFSTANFAGIVQHKIFFEPPADPLFRLRNADADSFLDIALPRAIAHFLRISDGLFSARQPFFWICLDGHFQKSGNFTEEFLAQMPQNLPVFRGNPEEIVAEVSSFLNS